MVLSQSQILSDALADTQDPRELQTLSSTAQRKVPPPATIPSPPGPSGTSASSDADPVSAEPRMSRKRSALSGPPISIGTAK